MFKIKKSLIDGKGVFAKEVIAPGTEFECDILIFNLDEAPIEIQVYTLHILTIGKTALCLGFGAFFNHSKERPSIEIKEFDLEEKLVIFQTTKWVDEGEELLMDYGYDL